MYNTRHGRQAHKRKGKECFYSVAMAIRLGLFVAKPEKKRKWGRENTTGALEKNKEGKWKETLLQIQINEGADNISNL